MKHTVNAAVHTPFGHWLSHHIFWLIVSVIVKPLLSIIFLSISALHGFVLLLVGEGQVPASARKNMAVVVTGCDTGFGAALAPALAEDGYTVFACCLKKESMDAIKASKSYASVSIIPVLTNVTDDESVRGTVETVTAWLDGDKAARRLHAVVNNAGVGRGGPCDMLEIKDYHIDMEVNYFGMIRTSKAFLPLLKQTARSKSVAHRPRIVNVTSVAGLTPCAFLGPYTASKHAAEAFTSALRGELRNWGIAVSTCNPSFHRTPLQASGAAMLNAAWAKASDDLRSEYGGEYMERLTEGAHYLMTANAWDPVYVTRALQHSVSALRPRSQYLVGVDAKFVLVPLKQLPSWLFERLAMLPFHLFSLPKPAASTKDLP